MHAAAGEDKPQDQPDTRKIHEMADAQQGGEVTSEPERVSEAAAAAATPSPPAATLGLARFLLA
jgi:hypothetical protein